MCIFPFSAGGGPVRLPGAMCLPHTNNMDSKLQGTGPGGGATLRPRAGGVPLEPFIHQVCWNASRMFCIYFFPIFGDCHASVLLVGGGSHEYDALRWPHSVQASDHTRAALLWIPASWNERVHSRVQRWVRPGRGVYWALLLNGLWRSTVHYIVIFLFLYVEYMYPCNISIPAMREKEPVCVSEDTSEVHFTFWTSTLSPKRLVPPGAVGCTQVTPK